MSDVQTLGNGLNELLNGIQDVSATAIIISFMVVIYFIFKNREDVKDIWNWYKNYREKREEERSITFKNQENILILQKSFNELQEKQSKMNEENHKHWQTSQDIRNNYDDKIDGIRENINDIKIGISGMLSRINEIEEVRLLEEEKRKENERAKLKDSIGSLYRRCHEKQEWDYMDKDTLKDLLKQYEANGGLNSFVHDRVEPESYTWKLITKEEMDEKLNNM